MIYLTPQVARDLLKRKEKISTNLGISFIEPEYKDKFVILNGKKIKYELLEKIAKKENDIYILNKKAVKLQFYSDLTRKHYKLVSIWKNKAPVLQIAGIYMHRAFDIDPLEDAKLKVKIVGVNGMCLDCCTGLGYTAIQASRFAEKVITIEIDQNVLKMAKINPWSRKLFDSKNIDIVLGDVIQITESLKTKFDCIFHDPPHYFMAKHLYSKRLYEQFYRLLKPEGKLFHYTGTVGAKRGKFESYKKMIEKKLKLVGFKTSWIPDARGFLCEKFDF